MPKTEVGLEKREGSWEQEGVTLKEICIHNNTCVEYEIREFLDKMGFFKNQKL
jgi:hypothetical protein